MIRFQCPACQTVLQIAPERAGAVVACAKCRQRLRVPALAPAPPPPAPVVATPPIRRVGRGGPSRRAPASRFQPAVLFGIGAVLLVLVGIGLSAFWFVFRSEPPVATVEQPIPEPPAVVRPDLDREPVPPPIAKPVEPPAAPLSEMEQQIKALVDLINRQRAQESVPPVKLDAELSRGCREHAAYLLANSDVPLLDPHDQAAAGVGASDAGRAAARAATVTRREPREAVRGWLSAPVHRSLLLAATLKSIGIGLVRSEEGSWVGVFDFVRGQSSPMKVGPTEPVLYPAPGQSEVPLLFPGNEVPDPLPQAKDKLAGYPITATFPPRVAVPTARAWLEDEAGVEVPVWFSSPTRPANEKYPRTQQNTICLLSHRPLEAGRRYLVRVEATVGGEEWGRTWTFTTQSPGVHGRSIYERALAQFNEFRAASGLEPLSLDETLCSGSLAHARYLALHLDRTDGVRLDDEKEDLEGYTPEGKQIAARSMVRMGGGVSPIDATDWAMASVLNRHLILNPTMRTLGLGAAIQAPRGWIWVLHPRTNRRKGDGPLATLYPGKNQKEIPIYYGREIQSMLPDQPKDAAAGYPITANFFPLSKITNASGTLRDGDGKLVPCWVSTPEKPLPSTGTYRQILLLPQKPLAPGATYTAEMTARVDGVAWSEKWSFSTLDHGRFRERTGEALLNNLNAIRSRAGLSAVELDDTLSDACQKHADYIARNVDHPKVQGLGIHDEEPSLPGYSPEGAKAGAASVIAIISDPLDSVENWMATLYHRIPLLDPRVKRIGYGQRQHPTRGWITVLDSSQGR